jgi:hypothetical protein
MNITHTIFRSIRLFAEQVTKSDLLGFRLSSEARPTRRGHKNTQHTKSRVQAGT